MLEVPSRTFYSKFVSTWTYEFFSREWGTNGAQCLICKKLVVRKKYNVKRHYDFCHGAQYDSVVGNEREELIEELTQALVNSDNLEDESEEPQDIEKEGHIPDTGASSSKEGAKENVRGTKARKSSKDEFNALSQTVQALQEISNQNTMLNEFQTFGQHVASQLEQLPLKDALEIETQIIEIITGRRIKVLQEREGAGTMDVEGTEQIDIKPTILHPP